MSNIVNLGKEIKYTKEQELYRRIHDLIHEYDGELSLVAVLGVLELAKDHVIKASS
jgi:hypothetical protein